MTRDMPRSLTRHIPCRSGLLSLIAALPLTIGACEQVETAAGELDGVWQSKGYGMVAEIDGNDARLIERTPVSCLVTSSGTLSSFQQKFDGTFEIEDERFAIGSHAALSTKTFDRLDDDSLERLCPEGLTAKSSDPELNFEVLWQTFKQHYAFFDERDVDWEAVYAEFRPGITRDTSSRELGRTLDRMLERLKDAHISLYVDGDDVVSVESAVSIDLANQCREQEGNACNLDRYVERQYEAIDDIIKETYLDNEFETALRGYVRWGEIDDTTVYFRIDAMAGFAGGHYSTSDDLDVLEPVLDDMLDDIGDLPTMIVDVRLNGGGHDTAAVAIANRFADQRRVFGSKRAFLASEPTSSTDMVVEPSDEPRYGGRVAVLTSGETASAAEIFVMAMRVLPNVTVVGTPTQGILSDEFYRSLPNGWTFSLSNEIYLADDGRLFEVIGVPPDVEAAFLHPKDLAKDIDDGIDTAMAILSAPEGQPAGSGITSH